jgi:hypothetical protein
MPSWRDTTSPRAQGDLDQLLHAALGFARRELTDRGCFYPFAAAIRINGQPEMIAASLDTADGHLDAGQALASCLAQLSTRQHDFRAIATVTDVRLPAEGEDAIEVVLEHFEGQALRILLPYTQQNGQTRFGTISASAGNRRIWSHS